MAVGALGHAVEDQQVVPDRVAEPHEAVPVTRVSRRAFRRLHVPHSGSNHLQRCRRQTLHLKRGGGPTVSFNATG